MEFLYLVLFYVEAFFVLVLLYVLLLILVTTYKHLTCRYLKKPKDLRECYGEWAVVTGGSYGIGKSYANELAQRKMNIILVSRSEEKLRQVAHEISLTHGVKTKYVVADLSQGQAAVDKIDKELTNLDVGILVNNAATAGGFPCQFKKVQRQSIYDMSSVNMSAVADLMYQVLPGMRARGRGLIVNVSSVASLGPLVNASVYSACKAYVTNLSETIRIECASEGIDVQTLTPGFVQTALLHCDTKRNSLPTFLNPTPEAFAKSAVDTIGHMKLTSGTLWHDLQTLDRAVCIRIDPTSDAMEVLLWVAFLSVFLVVLAVVAYFGYAVVYIFYKYFICVYFKKPIDLKQRFGSWAVITGSSQGIGKHYAIELAKRNINLVLVSRSEEKLKAVSQDIGEKYGVKTKYVVADLGSGRDATEKISSSIQGLDIGILVNNAATPGGLPNYFYNLQRNDIWNLLTLNICSLTDLVQLVLPGMRERRRGLIVNVSSVAALAPNPIASIYAASKGY
ncbi:Hypothetical predicted protein [Cloeon dipterum]|uniref:Uncharacterized protein n=1 Tax=Cloeon dipterum TaxID=197152 RepID=A0A8S1DXJ3_9INSE|nr:Hypothetical predicted protein [Cloeon dipterum]